MILAQILDGILSRAQGRWALGGLWKFLYWIFMGLSYERLTPSTFVSPAASVHNWSRVRFGDRNVINRNCIIWATLKTGENCHFNPGVCVYGQVYLGNNVMIAPNVVLAGGNHGIDLTDVPMYFQNDVSIGISVGSDVWIGANAVITDGVSISDGVVIGAGAVVTRDVPANAIVLGNPARILRKRQ